MKEIKVTVKRSQEEKTYEVPFSPKMHVLEALFHIHENIAGILAQINSIFASHKIKIAGQYLKTNQDLGYAITDVESQYDKKVIDALESIPSTIRVIVPY